MEQPFVCIWVVKTAFVKPAAGRHRVIASLLFSFWGVCDVQPTVMLTRACATFAQL
jgi:hypothetical protein